MSAPDRSSAAAQAKPAARPIIDESQARARAELDARTAELRALREALRSETRRREAAEQQLVDCQRRHAAELAASARCNATAELAGTLAHQLGQPLAAALNYLHGCRLRLANRAVAVDPVVLDGAIASAIGHAEQAGAIVRQVRRFVARHEPELRPIDLGRLIDDTLAPLRAECAALGIDCRLTFGHHDRAALADPLELRQVLANLVSNALDALRHHDGSRRLAIVTVPIDGGRRVAVSIADSGPGIAPDVLPRIFDSWFTTKRKGLGLGLAVCRTIIESHGGQLAAGRSTLGGALFRFDLSLVNPA